MMGAFRRTVSYSVFSETVIRNLRARAPMIFYSSLLAFVWVRRVLELWDGVCG